MTFKVRYQVTTRLVTMHSVRASLSHGVTTEVGKALIAVTQWGAGRLNWYQIKYV